MALKISYLYTRSGRLYFRRRIPEHLHELAGQREWKVALGLKAGQEKEATERIVELVNQTDAALSKLENGIRTSIPLKRNLSGADCEALTFSEAFDLYQRQREGNRVGKAEQAAFDQLIEYIGDSPLADIDRACVRSWVNWLEAERGQSTQTIRRRLGSAKAIFNSAIDTHDLPYRNPFARQRLRHQTPLKRLPFHKTHLELIADWVGRTTRESPTATIIQLLKHTGCRPLEIGGLAANDVEPFSETPFLIVRSNSRRQLKTQSSERIVPLVGEAIAVAKRAKSAAVDQWLFPASCTKTELLSARLNKAIRAAGVPKSPALTAYSFRHTFVEAMRRARIRPEIQRVLVGHQRASITDFYGANTYDFMELLDAIKATLPQLGDVSIQHYQGLHCGTQTNK
ncbi:site-specific integrase [Hyphobacterium indicum]|uniref:site-specific integrase n=1 Tax=Hyphobacterium indicum TaxID=2162714 RepID=UPI001374C900|nr:site-specific integrase [Hyphobacterium indicum]